MEFGEYIKEKRLEKGFSLSKFANNVGISPSYLSDIEKGRRNAPKKDKLDKIAEELFFSEEDLNKFYDLAGFSKNYVANDLSSYVMENKDVRYFLRSAKNQEDNILEDINFMFNNSEVHELVKTLREKKYSKEELQLLLSLIRK